MTAKTLLEEEPVVRSVSGPGSTGGRTIIFITVYPFNEDYALKYGFDILREKGFHVVILNVFNFIYPEAVEELSFYNTLEPVCGVEQICVKSEREFEKRLKVVEGWKIAFLVVAPYFPILRSLKRENVAYIRTFANAIPDFSPSEGAFRKRFFQAALRLLKDPVTFFKKTILPKIPYSLLGVDHPKYVILGSDSPDLKSPSTKTRVIHAHSYDYDRYLRNKDNPRPEFIPEGDYFVHLANHPWTTHGYVILNLSSPITKEEYKKLINDFHDFIEEKTGTKVVIAAYPKATDDENIYHGRPFIRYKTEELVKYSRGVISHYTNALNFAVIHDKPVCYISTRKLDGFKIYQNGMIAFSKSLGLEINYIDTPEDWNRMIEKGIFSHSPEDYRRHARKYITCDKTETRLHWEIVADMLLQNP